MTPPAEMPGEPPANDDEKTGLPLLRSWRAVYGVVLAVFVGWVVLLTALSWWYA